jgi:nucleotide-binding universal stress UspA family protein
MTRILVVANQTLGGDHLVEELRSRVSSGVSHLHVLVPASSDPQTSRHDETSDRALARGRLDEAVTRFRRLGVEVTGEVGDHRPVDAVRDVLRRERFDAIVLSTLPAGISRWLGLDVVSQVERAAGSTPVTHVVARERAGR